MWKNKPKIELIELNHFILDQLHLEEQLLRSKETNYCILSMGSRPAIVMGISKKPKLELHPRFFSSSIPLIQRFSGGGTVVIDQNTLFFTLIINKSDLNTDPFPEKIMRAIEPIFQDFFPKISLKENDFVIGARKVAGNAQYLTKKRVLHHTSFLWDFEPKNMDYLLLPQKVPEYRKKRTHFEFLTTLKQYIKKQELIPKLKQALHLHFNVKETKLNQIPLTKSVPLATKKIELASIDLKDAPSIG